MPGPNVPFDHKAIAIQRDKDYQMYILKKQAQRQVYMSLTHVIHVSSEWTMQLPQAHVSIDVVVLFEIKPIISPDSDEADHLV